MSVSVEPIVGPEKKYVRLLVCHECRSVDQVPDYSGPSQYDHYLEYRASQHETNGRRHKGILVKVEDNHEVINATIDEIEDAVRQSMPGAGQGLGQVMYDLRDNFQAEAMLCWKRHNRRENCEDYRADKMRLWLDTKAERKEEGLSVRRDDRPNVWLCDHCPVQSIVSQRQRAAKGLYDK